MKSSLWKLGTFLVAAAALSATARLNAVVFVETAQITPAGGAAGDFFAAAVALDGDVAVASADEFNVAFTKRGIAYVFTRSGGTWSQAATLLPSDSAVGDLFGTSVAISGDTIAVGAPNASIGPGRSGKIYVFVKPSGGWAGTLNESAVLQVGVPGGEIAGLGLCVAVTPNYIVAGSPTTVLEVPGGALFVFNKPSSGWSGTLGPSAILFASDGVAGDQLGNSVAASGRVIVAGAPIATDSGLAQAGKAYVFTEPVGGWLGPRKETAELLPSDPIAQGVFGASVAIDGNTAVVTEQYVNSGAPGNDSKGYVFVKPLVGWGGTVTEDAQLVASDTTNSSVFGSSASISGDLVVIGAIGQDNNQGSAYLFARPAGGWTGTLSETEELNTGAALAWFGTSVSVSGETILVGAPRETVGGNVEQGQGHIFDLLHIRITRIRFLIEGPIRVAPGVPVEFPIQVETRGDAPVPNGEFLVSDNAGHVCRGEVSTSGLGSCQITFGAPGTFEVRARYLGNGMFRGSVSPALRVLVRNAGR